MSWWRGYRGGPWSGPWPGHGPFSYLPPWERPGYYLWGAGTYGAPYYAATPYYDAESERRYLESQRLYLEDLRSRIEDEIKRIDERLAQLKK